MNKSERQKTIKELISTQDVENQEGLVQLLSQRGINVTQATISRDIKDMQLIKEPNPEGGYHYSLPVRQQPDIRQRLAASLKNDLKELKVNDRFVALLMVPGCGPSVSQMIQRAQFPQVFISIGDDATVLIVCNSATDARKLADHLRPQATKN